MANQERWLGPPSSQHVANTSGSGSYLSLRESSNGSGGGAPGGLRHDPSPVPSRGSLSAGSTVSSASGVSGVAVPRIFSDCQQLSPRQSKLSKNSLQPLSQQPHYSSEGGNIPSLAGQEVIGPTSRHLHQIREVGSRNFSTSSLPSSAVTSATPPSVASYELVQQRQAKTGHLRKHHNHHHHQQHQQRSGIHLKDLGQSETDTTSGRSTPSSVYSKASQNVATGGERVQDNHHHHQHHHHHHHQVGSLPLPSGVQVASPAASRLGCQHHQQSKWQKLLSAFRKNRSSSSHSSASHSADAFCLKHSHDCSNSFLRAGISNMKGYKKANQDRCTAFSYLDGDPDLSFFAVYDGHGGTGVANYLKDHLHEFILCQPEYKAANMEDAVLHAFMRADEELRTYGAATELTGSTATLIMIKHGELLCANLGDSRAMACVQGIVKVLSQDHNTSNSKERERVYAMGGTIKDNRVGGVLIPTRSFGDFLLKSEQGKPAWKQVISVIPQIQMFKLSPHWEFVVVGSDGVWDAMTNVEMSEFVRSHLFTPAGSRRDKVVLSELCEQILDMCCAKTVGQHGKNSCDNMTIIIIWFDHGDHNSEAGGSVVSSSVSSASR